MTDCKAQKFDDLDALYTVLADDPVPCAYMLANLEEAFAPFCSWYGVGDEGAVDGLVLVYTAYRTPVVTTYGQAGSVRDALMAFHHVLPDRAHVHIQPHHLAASDQVYEAEGLVPVLRLAVDRESFVPARTDGFEIEQLSHRSTGEIIELYQYYPDSSGTESD